MDDRDHACGGDEPSSAMRGEKPAFSSSRTSARGVSPARSMVRSRSAVARGKPWKLTACAPNTYTGARCARRDQRTRRARLREAASAWFAFVGAVRASAAATRLCVSRSSSRSCSVGHAAFCARIQVRICSLIASASARPPCSSRARQYARLCARSCRQSRATYARTEAGSIGRSIAQSMHQLRDRCSIGWAFFGGRGPHTRRRRRSQIRP